MGLAAPVTGAFGTFAPPIDGPGWAALCAAAILGVAICFEPVRRRLRRVPERQLVVALALIAAGLSAGYVVHYLRGGPRIIDATAYFLQGRALAAGDLAFDVPAPSGSFRGRFLMANDETRRLSVIFPPGYPALLAVGFAVGAPLAVGPVLAALLVVLTYALGRRLFADRTVALLAAALSTVSAALRYHTADTMSHGWSATLLSGAVLLALGKGRSSALGAGLGVGWLLATRPVTGVLAAAVVLAVAGRRRAAWLAGGALPGVALLGLHQYAATGELFASTQLGYYALADGPPGCFRYGFGSGIGCLGEHGDFVRHNLPDGYGLVAAAGTTLRRLKLHLLDVANFELLALLLPIGAVIGWQRPAVRLVAVVVVGLVLCYAPFYFDGNYPGGGARLLSDALPFEHVGLAWTLQRLSLARAALPVALAGFSLHASHAHRELADREGGRPMFEPSVVRAAGVARGLLFVGTDHGFLLGHDPEATASDGWVVARWRGDDHDALLHQWLGRPPAYVYHYDTTGRSPPHLAETQPPTTGRFEMEAEWPPLALSGGYTRFDFAPCASAGRALSVVPVSGPATIAVEIGVARRGRYHLETSWLSLGRDWVARVGIEGLGFRVSGRQLPACFTTSHGVVPLEAGIHRLSVRVRGGVAGFDAVHLRPVAPGAHVPWGRKDVDMR